MKPLRALLPVAVFGVSFAGTILFRKSGAPAPPAPAKEPTAGPLASRGKAVRTESTFAVVRALLRNGRIDEARALLRQLGSQDPVAFFKLLGRLPGLPGMEDIIRETAGRLPWNQPSTTELLNQIGTNDWRDLAWRSYIDPRVGVLPDEEVFQVGAKAREYRSMSALGGLFKDAAEKRPDAFLAFLNKTSSTFLRVPFFEELMKFHPERAGELFDSIPDGVGGSAYDKAYILDERIKALPTAENLQAVLLERGGRGMYDQSAASFLVCGAISRANPQQRAEILEWIGTQPPIARNRLLGGIVFSTVLDYNDPIPPAEFSKVLETYTSGYLQEKALDTWLKRNKDLDQNHPGWIEMLPSERLRNHARVLQNKREGEGR